MVFPEHRRNQETLSAPSHRGNTIYVSRVLSRVAGAVLQGMMCADFDRCWVRSGVRPVCSEHLAAGSDEVRLPGLDQRIGQKINGGWGGIRTHGTLSRTPVFKTGAFNRSATHPATFRAISCPYLSICLELQEEVSGNVLVTAFITKTCTKWLPMRGGASQSEKPYSTGS
tara:strand:- start:1023 stop:1532 length:510 start_codon:yes stop_codon:yes gene_type:complete